MPETDQASSLHFLDYWRIVRKRKEVIIASFIIIVIMTMIFSFTMKSVYMATTKLLIERDMPVVSVFGQGVQLGQSDPAYYQTQYEVLQSEPILEKTIKDLGLRAKWARTGEVPLHYALKILKQMVNVRQFRGTNIVSLNVFSYRKEEAADIANKIAESYVNSRMEFKHNVMLESYSFLDDQLAEMKIKVIETEAALEELKQEKNLALLDGKNIDKQKLAEFNNAYIRAKLERTVKETRLNELKKLSSEEKIHALSVSINNPTFQQLHAELSGLKIRLSALLEDYKERHPLVIQVAQQIKETETELDKQVQGIINGLEADFTVAQDKEKTLEEVLGQFKEQNLELDQKTLDYIRLARENEINKSIYMTLMSRVKEGDITKGMPTLSVEVIEPAKVPIIPVRPRKMLNFIVSIFVGLTVGTGLAYFLEYLDVSLKNAKEIEEWLHLPVLGTIPDDVGSLIGEDPDSYGFEPYRMARMHIEFKTVDNPAKTILITSAAAGEGKTTSTCNLAIAFAHHVKGKTLLVDADLRKSSIHPPVKTLVMDADVRRPSVHNFFELDNEKGVATILTGKHNVGESIRPTKVEGLDILTSGTIQASAPELVGSDRMKELIGEVSEKYDIVLIDAPPALGFSDTPLLAAQVDAVILVLEHRRHSRDVSARAKKVIEEANGKIIGVILNKINVKKERDYYYYDRQYYHYYRGAGAKKA